MKREEELKVGGIKPRVSSTSPSFEQLLAVKVFMPAAAMRWARLIYGSSVITPESSGYRPFSDVGE